MIYGGHVGVVALWTVFLNHISIDFARLLTCTASLGVDTGFDVK